MTATRNHVGRLDAYLCPTTVAIFLAGVVSCEEGLPEVGDNVGGRFREAPSILTSAEIGVAAGHPLVPLRLARPERTSSELADRAEALTDALSLRVPSSTFVPWFTSVSGERYRTHFESFDNDIVVEYHPYIDQLVASTRPTILATRTTGVNQAVAAGVAEEMVEDLGRAGLISGSAYGVVRSEQTVISAKDEKPHVHEYIFHFKRFEHGFMIRNSDVEIRVAAADGAVTRLGVMQVALKEELPIQNAQIDSDEAVDRAEVAIGELAEEVDIDLKVGLATPLPAYLLGIDDEEAVVLPEMHVRWTPYREGGPVGRGMSGSIGFKQSSAFEVDFPQDKPLLCKKFAPGDAIESESEGATTRVTVDRDYIAWLAVADHDQVRQCERIQLVDLGGNATVVGVRATDVAAALGFKNGDTDVEVCDWTGGVVGACFEIEDVASIGDAAAGLQDGREFRVRLTRAGQLHTIYYAVE